MKTTTRSRTLYTIPGPNIEVELPLAPSGVMDYKDAIISIDLVGGQIQVGYLVDDSDCDNPLDDDDYAGKIFEARRGGPTLKDYEKARAVGPYEGEAPDRYLVLLDVFEHGQVQYSVTGTGPSCRFDTARAGACYVPGDEQREELDKLPRDVALARVREMAVADAKVYTDWRNGECYIVVVATYDDEGKPLDWDSVGGYIGADEAYAELKSQMEPA